jgi:hypothetical protein
MIWDALMWLAIAKVVVMLFDDAQAAARGKQSPRLKDRARRREAEATGERPSGAWGRTRAAIGDYLAGLVEDGASAARAGRRRRRARKRGRSAVDGVLIDIDDDTRWYADCDTCGWSSRPFAIETNARLAGTEHARTHRNTDDQADGDGGDQAPTGDEKPRRRLTVIPGGDGETGPAAPAGPTSTVVHDDHTYCLGCPTCRPPRFGWRCYTCGTRDESFATEDAARAAVTAHICPDPPVAGTDLTDPAGTDAGQATTDPADGAPAAGTNLVKELTVNLEATGPDEIRSAFTTAVETTNERAEEIGGVAGVLIEAADRYESLEMAPSTVAHIREAAEQFTAAEAALASAAEELEAGLADFNNRDGQVAETVADAGNLASKEVLVG